MKAVVLVALNLVLVGLFVFILKKRELLTYYRSGRLWLTWLAIGIITLMDEFTSIFYAPAESYRFIGSSAIVFIALTSILIRFMSTRFVEIAEILEHHGLIGGGVYSFSYLVLGPTMSFVAVSSIMVDYILTACISAVSAVLNASSFFPAISNSPHLVIDAGLRHHLAYRGAEHPRHSGKCAFYVRDFHVCGIRHSQPDCLGSGRTGPGIDRADIGYPAVRLLRI